MTQQTETAPFTADNAAAQTKPTGKTQISIDEIAESFQTVGADIVEIGKLSSEEKAAVEAFLSMLKANMEPVASSIPISTKIIPIEFGSVSEAHIQPTGNLELSFSDQEKTLIDLSDPKNRDLMIAVMDDFVPKFEALTLQIAAERLRKPTAVESPKVEAPVPIVELELSELEHTVEVVAESPALEPESELADLPEPAEEPPQQEELSIDLLTQRNAAIEAVATEALTFLDMLGGEVFEQEPVSKYFDDWMVNLRQVVLSFESNEVIGADETFAAESNQIFGHIQEELDNRIASEAEMAVSYRTLVENRYLLNKINEEHAAQTKELVEKGTSAIETLMLSMQIIEKELAEVQALKVSYRHPLQKLAKDQKIEELTQRLNSVKRRLALAVGSSSVDAGKSGDIEAQFEAQTRMLQEKRKVAMEFLTKNVDELANEIAKLKLTKTSNPIKRVAIQQQVFETEQKLFDAKKRLELAEKNSSAEMENLRAEYEKRKQAALGKMQTLEQDIATKAVDNSAEVRKQAAKALAEAVKTLARRKTEAPLEKPLETQSEDSEEAV